MIASQIQEGWYVVRTGFRKEKRVLRDLRVKGIEAFVPLLKRSRAYTRKVKQYEVPLIATYVFVYLTKGDYIKILQTQFVNGFVTIDNHPSRIPEGEIDLLKRIVGEHLAEGITPINNAQPGQRVELIAGSLTGIQGLIVDSAGKHMFLVELDTLGYAIRISVDNTQLRLVA